ncbi:MAG: helicase-related protein [Anaerolineales bacterium]
MSADNFITNNPVGGTLKKRLGELISHSQELKFLVGFFYFSGWRELYQSLKTQGNLRIKILVGLEVDRILGRAIEVARENGEASNDELADRLFASVGYALNDEDLDTEEFYEQVEYFLSLLESGRLEIKKTIEPNHAKLYLFQVREELKTVLKPGGEKGQSVGKFITGSSNLTRSGIQAQREFNVEISDYGWEEAEKYFDELWGPAVPITEIPERRASLARFIRNRTQIAAVTPFEAYLLVLKAYLDLMEQKEIKPQIERVLEEKGYKKYIYQIDAVNQALAILDQYNGVLIADVVGLGKSIISSIISRDLAKRGIIICPPGLMGDEKKRDSGWWKYVEDFGLSVLGWTVHSLGSLDDTLEFLADHGDDIDVVVVDEAHRFRNQDTELYEQLSAVCRNKKVILLTATPFNNAPADIFSLLKLFIVPGKSKITLDENLEARFSHYDGDFRRLSYISRYYRIGGEKQQRAEKYYLQMFKDESLPIQIALVKLRTKELAAQIRAVLEPVVIRRNRLDLKNDPIYSKEVTELSDVQDPIELFYGLNTEQMAFYDKVIDEYFNEGGRFAGAIYQPFLYEAGDAIREEKLDEEGNRIYQQQLNLYEFMRRLSVKRFESSFGAFAKSIRNFERVHERVLQFIENSGGKYILDRKLIEKIYDGDAEEIETALEEFAVHLAEKRRLPKHERIYTIEEFKQSSEFMQDIRSDLDLMKKIRKRVEELNLVDSDPKAATLIKELREIIKSPRLKGEPRRKIVVFTEYVDTVSHLRPLLEAAFPNQTLVVEGPLGAKLSRQILTNFDASLKPDTQDDDFRILLTSDKLSEGVNLHRAGAIINYDIPWNPTRVIQRVGRINRIGQKVFEKLNIYNFFPTEKGATVVKSREIASQKMFLIHATLGEDAKIFAIDETPTPAELFRRLNQNPEEGEEESTLTRVRRLFFDYEKKYPEIIERIGQYPPRVKTAKNHSANQLVVFRRKGLGLFIHGVIDMAGETPVVQPQLFEEALGWIECSVNSPRVPLSPRFWPTYETIKAHREMLAVPKSERSLEYRAENNLLTALNNYKDELDPYLPFIRTLILDMRDYKTLPKSTLRRLASVNLENGSPRVLKEFITELAYVRKYLGDDYLEVIKERLGSLTSEIIIAVENQTP